MFKLIALGGPVMIPIAACSILALGIFLERLVALRRGRVRPQSLLRRTMELVGDGRVQEARFLCQEHGSPLGRLLAAGLAYAGKDRREVKEAVEEVGQFEVATLERYIGVVATVASISPLLGLLGTVTGMIDVFQRVTQEGVGDPRLLANGIWEALITTAAGLAVAIPSYVFYRLLQARADQLVLDMEEDVLRVIAALPEQPGEEAA